jgi:hypothetical protein
MSPSSGRRSSASRRNSAHRQSRTQSLTDMPYPDLHDTSKRVSNFEVDGGIPSSSTRHYRLRQRGAGRVSPEANAKATLSDLYTQVDQTSSTSYKLTDVVESFAASSSDTPSVESDSPDTANMYRQYRSRRDRDSIPRIRHTSNAAAALAAQQQQQQQQTEN